MKLSIVIVTHNRAAALTHTLEQLAQNDDLPHESMEVIVVDNGSTDATTQVAQSRNDLVISVIRRRRNEGVSARNHAFNVAHGQYLLLIDDDSYPLGDAVSQSLAYLQLHPSCAAVVGRIALPDGRLEASALPSVVANGAVLLRKRVIEEVGGFPVEFFRQAEEYDLSFRIWNAGYNIARFEDVCYRHEKAGGPRPDALIHRMDMRNNMILLSRYLPDALRHEYRRDWILRYAALARHAGCTRSALRGRIEAMRWRLGERLARRPRLLQGHAVESIFGIGSQTASVSRWARDHGVRRVVIADFGKNTYATWRAAMEAGLQVKAVADRSPAFADLTYRDIPICPDEEVLPVRCDGVILANINPAQVQRRQAQLETTFDGPILTFWKPSLIRPAADRSPALVQFPSAHRPIEAA